MAISGRNGSVYVNNTRVVEIKKWSCDLEADSLETTNFDGNGWKEYIQGLRGWSGSFEGNYIPGGQGQTALINAFMNGDSVTLELRLNAGTTPNRITGAAYIKSISLETPVDDLDTISFDFDGSGAPTLNL